MRVQLFPIRRKASGPRGRRNAPTADVQVRLNAKNAEYALSDKLHMNFTPNDYTIELTYADEYMPTSPDAAQHEVAKYIERLRYQYEKRSLPTKDLKYIYNTEMASTGRLHHHCFISGHLDIDTIKKCWRLGHCHTEHIEFDENGVSGKAHYLLKDRVTYRRWNSSKNLLTPPVRQNDYRLRMKDARYINENPSDFAFIESLYPGYSVSEVQTTANQSKSIVPFLTIQLYRTDNAYFRRTRWGIDYTYKPHAAERKGLLEA
jgi:hypothetical protein